MDQCLQVALFAGTSAIDRQSNFIFSPLSLRAGLALLAAGTNGDTLSQLLAFLGSQELHLLNAASASLIEEMRAWPQLSFAGGIFVDRSISLRPEFVSTAASAHGAVARSLDFQNQHEAAAAEVNALIAATTRGRIRNLVSPDSLSGGDAKIVLANAMHFKATWAENFDDGDDGLGGFKVLRCLYKTVGPHDRRSAPRFSMLVFLPHRRDGLRDLLRLAVSEPGFVTRHAPRQLQVVRPCMVPKFKFSHRFDARDALCGLGLAAPFDPVAADLSGAVSNMPLMEGLCVSSVEQMCAVEVDEEGTTAVASFYSPTCPSYSPGQRSPPPPMSFVADHPFLFAIVEDDKAEVMFLGHVVDPSVQ
ncbi:unnamed protein product [Alopecurus aequalis]